MHFWNWKLYVMYDLSLNNSSSPVTGWCFQWFGRTHPRLPPVTFFLLLAAAHFSTNTFPSHCSSGCWWVVSIKSSAWCNGAIVPTFDANYSFMCICFYSMLCRRQYVNAIVYQGRLLWKCICRVHCHLYARNIINWEVSHVMWVYITIPSCLSVCAFLMCAQWSPMVTAMMSNVTV